MVSRASRKVIKTILILGFSGLLKGADSVILNAEVESVDTKADLATSVTPAYVSVQYSEI